MENNDNRSQQAQRTAQFSQYTKYLVEEVRTQDRTVSCQL